MKHRWKRLASSFSPLGWLLVVTLTASLLLGGGTRQGFFADTVLQLAALPLLLVVLERLTRFDQPCALVAAAAASLPLLIGALQLIPLPPSAWKTQAVGTIYGSMFDLTGVAPTSMPVSMLPEATAATLLACLPALAVFLATLFVGYPQRRQLVLLIMTLGLVGVVLGIVQVAEGPYSQLRFFPSTNVYDAVGFFANRNHFAALIYVLILFAAAFATNQREAEPNKDQPNPWVMTLLWFTILVVLLAAVALARSRTGLLLSFVALIGTVLIAMTSTDVSTHARRFPWLVGAAVLGGVVLSGQFLIVRILGRFTAEALSDGRVAFARNTWRAAREFAPFGSGLGTFVPIYQSYETPNDTIANLYTNHAHNDVLEFILETGVSGAVLMAAFVVWLAITGFKVWRKSPLPGLDLALARAAWLAIVLLSAHSLVDYPLRTGAMMSVIAFCCALMLRPIGYEASKASSGETTQDQSSKAEIRQQSYGDREPASLAATPDTALTNASSPLKERQLWSKVEWPQEWTSKATPTAPTMHADPPKPAGPRWEDL